MTALNELREHARRAGEKLMEDLRFAEVTTSGWSNRERSESEVARVMNDCLDDLASTNCWGQANRIPSRAFWKVAGERLAVGWLQNHAREKPRGYAGDFEMLEKIAQRTLCSDPLGRAFDAFFQSQAAPAAVRARMQVVADRILHRVRLAAPERVHICSVGSGPAIDIELACRALPPAERARLQVTLLDLDPEALVHAQQRLAPLLATEQLQLQRENLYRLPRLPRARRLLENADLIACTGLFDYLPDPDASAMLQCFWDHLAAAGEMIVFNFAPANPTRAYMEWIGNWYLIYRDDAAIQGLIRASLGTATVPQIFPDDSQASLHAICTKA